MHVIFHVDIDSFFVSAHQTINRFLVQKPVVVSTGKKRSIISAASYPAKARGIYVPMPFYKAKQLEPNLINIFPQHGLYNRLSRQVSTFLQENYTLQMEIASIDEWYLDVSNILHSYPSVKKLAQDMQTQIKQRFGLPVSIGVGQNKFVAKMATDISKPLGITIVKPEDFAPTFWSWPIEKYFGIGQRTASKLKAKGIFQIKDLARGNFRELKEVLGAKTQKMILQANGQGDKMVNTANNELKSIGNSKTFLTQNKKNPLDVKEELLLLVEKVSLRAKSKNLVGQVVKIEIQEDKKAKVSRQVQLEKARNDYETLAKTAVELFEKTWNEKAVRFVGFTLNKLFKVFEHKYQPDIFERETNSVSKVDNIIKNVNTKFKQKVLTNGKEFILDKKAKKHLYKYNK